MTVLTERLSDGALGLFRRGYLWLPERRAAHGGCPVHTRLGPVRATALSTPDELAFFYDDTHVRRAGALPEPVVSTLSGHGAVHGLDGAEHRHRKAMFVDLLMSPGAVDGLTAAVAVAWDTAVADWAERDEITLFDESARLLTRGVVAWAGIEVPDHELDALTRDLHAMIDGFATAKPRHLRARLARTRREEWLAALVRDVRAGRRTARPGSALAVVTAHRDLGGTLLEPRVAAVELLNVVRPTVAVCWFVSYAAHAMHLHPETRDRLRAGDPADATAFAHELRRFYPFAPFVGGTAVRDLVWHGELIPAGSLVLADLYGRNHSARWGDPGVFRPDRFRGREIGPFELVPQGGGDPATGHRCPGERVVVGLLEALCPRLAALRWTVPEQDLRIPVNRIPARVRSGMVLGDVRPAR